MEIATLMCDQAPVDGPVVYVAEGQPCPYCGDPVAAHDQAGTDTKSMRRIETDSGHLVGSVDRALRKVIWHLECPDCQTPIRFTDDTFHGRGPLVCECGWRSRPIGHKDRSENGSVYAYYDYSAIAFGESSGCDTGGEGIHAGMGF